jgi:pyruvate-ferredoxin/flavodoxin oxidoreductase
MELPMTFADFAITEVRFRKHFRAAPPDTWNEKMVPLHEFLDLADADREDLFPYIWTVDRKNHLSRLLVDEAMVRSCEDRRDFWQMLRALAGVDRKEPPLAEIESRIRQDVLARITQGLAQIASGEGGAMPAIVAGGAVPGAAPAAAAEAPAAAGEPQAAGDYMAAWLDTDECTACDECMRINSSIFAYNEDKKAYLKDPEGGPYTDLVKAAEKCTAQVIHPGLPRDRSAADIDKWITRGSKYN